MDRTRLYLLAQTADISCIEEPPAPGGGGNEAPPEGGGEKHTEKPAKEAEGDDEDDNDFDSLPAWAKAQIKDLRKESGRYRTSNKELQDKLKDAKSQADIDAAIAEHKKRNSELEVELATAKHTAGFTPEQLALVHGNTPEEIEESANKIRAAFAAAGGNEEPPAPGADGGRRPGLSDGSGLSPRELAERTRARSRRR